MALLHDRVFHMARHLSPFRVIEVFRAAHRVPRGVPDTFEPYSFAYDDLAVFLLPGEALVRNSFLYVFHPTLEIHRLPLAGMNGIRSAPVTGQCQQHGQSIYS